jgi:hypothetical protein
MSNEYNEEQDLYGDIEDEQYEENRDNEREEGETRDDNQDQPPVPPRPADWPADVPWPLPAEWRTRQPIIIVDQTSGNMTRKRDPLDNLKFHASKLPKLGAKMKFPEWRLRLLMFLDAADALPMLHDPAKTPDRWPRIKAILIESVEDADFHIMFHANTLFEAYNGLKQAHSANEATEAMDTQTMIFSLVPEPQEPAHSVITRIRTLNSYLMSLDRPLPQNLLASAAVKALSQVPAYAATINTLKTVGKEITIQVLQDAFATQSNQLIVPGAHMASGSHAHQDHSPDLTSAELDEIQTMQESMANLARQINDLKSKQNNPQWWGKQKSNPSPYKSNNQDTKKHGFGGRGRGRGRGRGQHGVRQNVRCHNCGLTNHVANDCNKPCGICASSNHKAPDCVQNPHSRNYVPVSKRSNQWTRDGANKQKKQPKDGKGKANLAMSSIPDISDDEGTQACANMAVGTASQEPEVVYQFMELPEYQALLAASAKGNAPDAPAVDVFSPTHSSSPVEELSGGIGEAFAASVMTRTHDTLLDWYTDGGATHHFTPFKSLLFDYKPDNPSTPVKVKVANNQYVLRAGVGNLRVKTNVGGATFLREIRGVWHVPTFGHSLLSVNRLKACGVSHFSIPGCMDDFFWDNQDKKVWLVSKYKKGLNSPDWEIVEPMQTKDYPESSAFSCITVSEPDAHALLSESDESDEMRARVAAFHARQRDSPVRITSIIGTDSHLRSRICDPAIAESSVPDIVPQANFASRNVSVSKESVDLWHQRLGHTNMRGLQNLVRTNKITGISIPASKLVHKAEHRCQICVMAKHSRSPFHLKHERATEPMWALHTDQCGPYPVPTIGGAYYAQSLLDEHSGHGGMSILKKKSDGPPELKRMILAWEALTGKKCKILYSDRGGEYINDHLKDWLLEKGIKHIFSTPRTPEENGKAERFNRTINDFVRALLFQYGLYLPLWGHAMLYAVQIYNCMWNARLKMSRHEAFTGKIPDVAHFRTFGCKVYARVPDDARNKLDPKSQIGIFLGPESNGPGFKVLTYNPTLKRDKYQVRIFRDIVCYEDLQSTTGVQETHELHWGGHIPMPQNPEPVEMPAAPKEPLTGVPEALEPQSLPKVASGLQHMVCGPEGAVMHTNQHPPSLQGPLPGSVAGSGGSDSVAHRLGAQMGAPVTKPKRQPAVPQHNVGTRQLAKKVQPKCAIQQPKRADQVNPPRKHVQYVTPVKPTKPPVSLPHAPSKPPAKIVKVVPVPFKIPDTPVGSNPRILPSGPMPVHPITRLAPASSCKPPPAKIVRIVPVPPMQQIAQPVVSHVPAQPAMPTNPAGENPFRNMASNPIEVPINLTRSPYPLRSKGPISLVHAPTHDSSNRHLAFHVTAEDALRIDEVPFDPSAFLASAPPYPQPNIVKAGITLPSKDELVEGLLRTFEVPQPTDGKIYTLTDAKGVAPPKTIREAMKTPLAKQWAEATIDEWLSLQLNDTWHLVDKEPWMKVIPCKWVYTVKPNEYGIPVRFKARLVAGGHRQIEGIDYDETYAPVSRHSTLRTLFAVAAHNNWKVHQLDITTAFLHGTADQDIYMMQPPGFNDCVGKVLKLDKTIYGLKQSPRVWYETLSKVLKEIGFNPVSADSSFWIKKDQPVAVYLTSVVDDMLITCANESLSLEIRDEILSKFPGKPLGEARHYNGAKINWFRKDKCVVLSCPAHILKIVEEFGHLYDFTLPRSVPMKPGLRLSKTGTSDQPNSPKLDVKKHPFRTLLGKCGWLAGWVRPDIAYVVNQSSRYANDPTEALLEVIIDLIRYLVHTKDWGICLGKSSKLANAVWKTVPDALAFADANHGTGMDDKRSVSGMVLQVYGGPVSWSSRVQPVTSSSTTESEYRALADASREALWLAKIIKMFGIKEMPFPIRGDSRGALCAIRNYQYTKHTKHIEIHLDFMRDRYAAGVLDFDYVEGKFNPADIFTKALPRPKFEECRELLGMMEVKE